MRLVPFLLLRSHIKVFARRLSLTACVAALAMGLAACAGSQAQTANPTGETFGAPQVGVNAFIWRATLDAFASMPLQAADPIAGVISTDWVAPPGATAERFKAVAYIRSRALRADGLRVAVFRETYARGIWRAASTGRESARLIEAAILTRARRLRLALIELQG